MPLSQQPPLYQGFQHLYHGQMKLKGFERHLPIDLIRFVPLLLCSFLISQESSSSLKHVTLYDKNTTQVLLTIKTLYELKELEHRKLGWKALILKYDLGKSLEKKCDIKWLTLKKFLTTYFKRWKMHVIWSKSFLCPWTWKWFPLIMNGILEMSWFVHIFL